MDSTLDSQHPLDEKINCRWCGGGYTFVTDLVQIGAKRVLEDADVFPLPREFKAEHSEKLLETTTNGRCDGSWWLWKSLWTASRWRIFQIWNMGLCFLVSKLGTPLAFWWFLVALEDDSSAGQWRLYTASLLLTALCCSISVFVAAFTYHAGNLGVAMRQSLAVAIYNSLLRLPAFGENSASVTSHLSVDAERIFQACQVVHLPLFCFGLLIGGTAIVALQVGIPAAGSVLLLLGSSQVLQHRIQLKVSAARRIMIGHTDRRVALTTQLLQGMRPIRMNGWDPMLREQIEQIRAAELRALRHVQRWQALNYALNFAVSPACTVLLLTVFALTNGIAAVTPQRFFVVVSTVNPCIRVATDNLPRLLNRLSDVRVSVERLARFLKPGEVAGALASDTDAANLKVSGSFMWPGARQDSFQLKNLAVSIESGSLVCILGEVDRKSVV